ncbi:MAG: TrkA C-terminal domain-containing protein [Ilumatobacteraceae bacterium]
MFDVVFVTVLASLIVQAGTVGWLVKRFGFADEMSGAHAEIAVLDALVADLIELRLTAESPVVGTPLRDHDLPNGARVALVVRDDETFVPDGGMVLTAGDVLLLAVAPDTVPASLMEWATRQA